MCFHMQTDVNKHQLYGGIIRRSDIAYKTIAIKTVYLSPCQLSCASPYSLLSITLPYHPLMTYFLLLVCIFEFYTNRIIVLLCVCFLSLSIVILRLIHIVPCINSTFLSCAMQHPTVQIYHNLYFYFHGTLTFSPQLWTAMDADEYIFTGTSLCKDISFLFSGVNTYKVGKTTDMAGMFDFLRYCQSVFQSE